MSHARHFDGWLRLPVSNTAQVLLTSTLDIEREVWSTLEYYSEVEEVGLNLIQSKGLQPQALHKEIFQEFQAFVRQAKSFYSSAKTLHYRSSSLFYYYSFLNLVKAYLVLKDPQRIMGRTQQSVTHGLSYRTSSTNQDFQLEVIRVTQGIFPLFYEAQTSNSISTARNSYLSIINLLNYPDEIGHQYQLAGYGDYRILPSLAALLTDQLLRQSWTIIGIPATASFDNFLNFHANFLNTYQEVPIDRNRLVPIFNMSAPELSNYRFFQDITPFPMTNGVFDPSAHREMIIKTLHPYFSFHYFDDNNDFDLVLPYTDRTNATPMPITEALAIYAVMFYLSSLVRYRPSYLEALLSTKPAWLIENFVNSTPETFLRVMVSKIIGRDYIFRRR